MTKREYLNQLSKAEIDVEKVDELQKLYEAELPDIVKKLVSNNDETIFLEDETRILSYHEIVNAEAELHVNFKENGIIPLADCGDNNFIVYHFNVKPWSKFNIEDETVFKKKPDLEDLLK